MKVQFIHHSSYRIETADRVLVFDYTEGPLDLPTDKAIYFVATHGHGDHFNPEIYRHRDRAQYILSFDIDDPIEDAHILHTDEAIEVDGMVFHGFGSTDEGLSILVEIDGKTIYHSGDLNFWLWPRYSAEDIEAMAQDFMREADKAAAFAPIDVVMGIVDPRMKDFYYLSSEYFLRKLKPRHFFPLHLWGDFPLSQAFRDKFEEAYATEIHSLKEDGEVFDINIQ
ncbi:L-ascorbate metabolism protein UlaG (beta-lactamase superfamily) [Peptoniphilus ivorii]|uniref:MBL fold metallo-hydrolase n=1 Tax=Aedoeadaptatus ivorii TaxID=54006 RepID=UPI0027847320|nr:MBL fold metallo-hydrolase [Peptoniphilus ivorii]MDQ0508322.1 L-ascorbate metabolism protein UlaG (beta-lactamase superfamily) [Peptoniphilus ivorii]